MTQHAHDAEGRGHRRQAEHDRQRGRHESAEREQQDDQGDRDRQGLGLLEVVVERLRQRLVRARVAELLDAQLRVSALRRRHRRQDRRDALLRLIRVAPDLELHEGRALVGGRLPGVAGGVRRGQLDHVGLARQPPLHVEHRCLELRVRRAQRAARLDQHLLARPLLQSGVRYRARGRPRVAVPLVLGLDVLHAGGAARQHADDHERDPSPDRELAMVRAPMAGARGKVASVHVSPLVTTGAAHTRTPAQR